MILLFLTVALLLLGCKAATTTTTVDPAIYEISNGGFETGDLSGWTVTSGTTFNRLGVTAATSFDGTVPYDKEGTYLYGVFAEELVGSMESEPFEIGGSGIFPSASAVVPTPVSPTFPLSMPKPASNTTGSAIRPSSAPTTPSILPATASRTWSAMSPTCR